MNLPLNSLQELYIAAAAVLAVGFFIVGLILSKVARKQAIEKSKITLWPMLTAFGLAAICTVAAIVLVPPEWWSQMADKIVMYKLP